MKRYSLNVLALAAVLFFGRAASYAQTQNDHVASIWSGLTAKTGNTPFTVGPGGTALMLAAANGHTETVKLLLERKADLNVRDNQGKTALAWAREKGHTEIIQLLEATTSPSMLPKDNTGNQPF